MKNQQHAERMFAVIGVAVALALSQAAFGADPSSSSSDQSGSSRSSMGSDRSMGSSSQSSTENQEHASGSIRSIDTSAGTVTVKGALLSKTFHVDSSALQGLKVGDRVDVTYTKQGDQLTASQITPSSESSSGSSSSSYGAGSSSRNPSPSSSSSSGPSSGSGSPSGQ